jgi:uncharacterized iron-regulated protein
MISKAVPVFRHHQRILVGILALLLGGAGEAVAQQGYVGLYEGATLRPIDISEAFAGVTPNTVIFLGENHGVAEHQRQHLEILNQLRRQGLKVSVGLEFLDYRYQSVLQQYRQGTLKEVDFLRTVEWGNTSFDFYRPQLIFPRVNLGEFSLAMNISRNISNTVMRKGLLALSEEDQRWLPPNFEVGRASYKKRFAESIPHEIPPEKLNNWFAAQSLWDDTVAWRAAEFMKEHPDQVLVVLMGDFHIQYGGGLPDRLRHRWDGTILSVSQVNSYGATHAEVEEMIGVHPEYGPRSDLIWVAEVAPTLRSESQDRKRVAEKVQIPLK